MASSAVVTIAAGVFTVDPYTRQGTGSPEGVETAPVGATYKRLDGTASTTFYVKESGVGNTGWVAYGAPGGGGGLSTKVLVNVGAGAAQSKTVTVTDAACLSTSTVSVGWGTVLAADENDPECDGVSFGVTPANGSFVVRVSSPDHRASVQGAYRLAYKIG
jgi:hypothetical protein